MTQSPMRGRTRTHLPFLILVLSTRNSNSILRQTKERATTKDAAVIIFLHGLCGGVRVCLNVCGVVSKLASILSSFFFRSARPSIHPSICVIKFNHK